jgi:hypothetical protein
MSNVELQSRTKRKTRTRSLLALGATLLISSASAQYAFDTPGDDHSQEGVRYFGSAKDEKGALVADVTFRLDSDSAAFMFISDAEGRFRGTLPLDIPFKTIKPTCFKDGLEAVRVTKRPGPRGAKQASVQVDCVLRKAATT